MHCVKLKAEGPLERQTSKTKVSKLNRDTCDDIIASFGRDVIKHAFSFRH